MRSKCNVIRRTLVILMIAVLLASIPVNGQDLIPVSDITGGSTVFVFRRQSATRKRPTPPPKIVKTRAQRVEKFVKARKQYETIAKVKPNRPKITVVAPDKVPSNIKTLTAAQGSKLFAGVGEYYLQLNDLDNAQDFYRQSLQLDAKNTAASAGLSETLAKKGSRLIEADRDAEARAFFQESLKYDPRNAGAFLGLGQIASEGGDASTAIANFEKALESDPDLTDVYQPLGILYYQAGEIAKADAMLAKSLRSAPNDAETQLFIGLIQFSRDRNNEALAAFSTAKQIDPTMAEAWFNTGEVFMRQNNATGAIAEYQKAIALKPNYIDAWFSLGNAYVATKNYTEAINAFKQTLKLKNTYVDAYLALAEAQRLSGLYKDAMGSYTLAATFMDRSPDYSNGEKAEVQSKLGFVIGRQCDVYMTNRSGTCDWASVIRALEKAVQLGGGDAADRANLGWAYYNAAREDGYNKLVNERAAKLQLARTNLESVVNSKPSFVDGPQMNLGMTCNDLGDYQCAVDNLSQVVKKKPDWAFAWNELGIAYRKQNNFSEAAEKFKKATEADPAFVVGYYNYGEAQIKTKNIGEAKKAYQKLKSLGQTNFANSLELMSKGAVRN